VCLTEALDRSDTNAPSQYEVDHRLVTHPFSTSSSNTGIEPGTPEAVGLISFRLRLRLRLLPCCAIDWLQGSQCLHSSVVDVLDVLTEVVFHHSPELAELDCP
jgi:hypothetical protein